MKIFDFNQNLDFDDNFYKKVALTKISDFYKNFDLDENFRFLQKNLDFAEIFRFSPFFCSISIYTKMSILARTLKNRILHLRKTILNFVARHR